MESNKSAYVIGVILLLVVVGLLIWFFFKPSCSLDKPCPINQRCVNGTCVSEANVIPPQRQPQSSLTQNLSDDIQNMSNDIRDVFQDNQTKYHTNSAVSRLMRNQRSIQTKPLNSELYDTEYGLSSF